MRVVMQDIVAGLADLEIELVVGTDRQILPAMGFVLRQIGIDDRGLLRSLVEIGQHIVDL